MFFLFNLFVVIFFSAHFTELHRQHSGVGQPLQNVRHLRIGHGEKIREPDSRHFTTVSLFLIFPLLLLFLFLLLSLGFAGGIVILPLLPSAAVCSVSMNGLCLTALVPRRNLTGARETRKPSLRYHVILYSCKCDHTAQKNNFSCIYYLMLERHND